MNIKISKLLLLCLLPLAQPALHAYDIPGYTPDQIIPFKQTLSSSGGSVTLNLHVFTPPGHQPSDSRPAVVFFFGGGWVEGSPSHFHPQCEYLASRGMVAISSEYRVKNLHGTTPQECVKDGKSAIRYVRENAATLGIDPPTASPPVAVRQEAMSPQQQARSPATRKPAKTSPSAPGRTPS